MQVPAYCLEDAGSKRPLGFDPRRNSDPGAAWLWMPTGRDRALSRKRHFIFGMGISGRCFCYKPGFVAFAGMASRAINSMSLHQTD
jgi:hypothetical protein